MPCANCVIAARSSLHTMLRISSRLCTAGFMPLVRSVPQNPSYSICQSVLVLPLSAIMIIVLIFGTA